MCAPDSLTRDAVAQMVNDVVPKDGINCQPTPRGVIDWIKRVHPDIWDTIVDLLSPFCGECDYRVVMNVDAIIRQNSGLQFGSGLVQRRAESALVGA